MPATKSSRKHAPTPAQQEAAKARRERFRAIVKQIAAMDAGQRAFLASKGVLMTCEGHTLSLGNQLLLALQCPDATIVGGFRQWKNQGRSVKKDEHGHMIWVPIGTGEPDADTPQPSDIEGEGEAKPTRLRFIVGTMFDIAQTEPSQGDRLVSYTETDTREVSHA